ncbi:MAG: hypothetical protein IPM34_14565 [Saprospiraceae bacterium]|nr:hypothetical protein [Saprospiraceae bacterium]
MNQNQTGVWMDGTEAFILNINESGRSVKHILSGIETHVRFKGEGKEYTRVGNVYIDPEKKHENRRQQQEETYFEKIAHELSDVEDFIVFGPAQMKTHFSKWAKEHREIREKLSACLTISKLTENQMFAFIQDHYTKN